MAWMAPIIANNRRNGSSRSRFGAVIAGLVLCLAFGVFFMFFFNRSGFIRFNSPLIFMIIGFGVFLIVIIGISATATSMTKTVDKPKIRPYSQYNTARHQPQRPNPYISRKASQESVKQHPEEFEKKEIKVEGEIKYCQYCGAKIDRDANFCYQCGSKIKL
ncbi:MAG: zinc-ribbon domain-containing protein [Promethearchaeota archaeon]|jgi:predicted lipid-binding transport protein (Tim44 family)